MVDGHDLRGDDGLEGGHVEAEGRQLERGQGAGRGRREAALEGSGESLEHHERREEVCGVS